MVDHLADIPGELRYLALRLEIAAELEYAAERTIRLAAIKSRLNSLLCSLQEEIGHMPRDRIKALLRLHEDEKLKPYLCPSGKLTIGVGRNLEDLGISKQESGYLLTNDIIRVEGELDRALPFWRTLSEVRRAVIADMCFNIGLPKLLSFRKMLAALQQDRYEQAADEMKDSKWHSDVRTRAERLIKMMRTDQWPPEILPTGR